MPIEVAIFFLQIKLISFQKYNINEKLKQISQGIYLRYCVGIAPKLLNSQSELNIYINDKFPTLSS